MPRPRMEENQSVWYFAYGSNMRPAVISGRGLRIAAAHAAVVPSYVLTFDVFGIPYTEPAMANIALRSQPCSPNRIPEQVPDVHGAVYLLSPADFTTLVRSEGAGTAYREVDVEAHALPPATQVIRAKTLVARYPFRPNAAPSARYLDVLVKGAEELHLPIPYVEYLQSLPSFSNPPGREQPGARAFIAFWMPLASHLMRWVKLQADEKGRAPEWMGGLVWLLFSIMWWYHDLIHSRVWSRGDGRRAAIRSAGSKERLKFA